MADDMQYFEGDGQDVAIFAASGVVVTMGTGDSLAPAKSAPGAPLSVSVPLNFLLGAAIGDVMPWGMGNNFPQRMIEQYAQDTIVPATLGKVASMIYGRGVMAVTETLDENGDEITRPVNDREILTFLSHFDTRRYLRETAADVACFFNAWSELILSKDRTKIVQVHPLNAEECRWGRMDDRGNLNHIYLSANWPAGNEGNAVKIPAIDPYRYDKVDYLRAQRTYNVVYPMSYPSPGQRFYAIPHHYSIITSGWLDVHKSVPLYKDYLMKNQMSIKYHWKVDPDYWPIVFGPEYATLSTDAKRAKKKDWLANMQKSLTNVEKTGTSIVTERIWDVHNHIYRDLIVLEVVKDNQLDGKWIEDNLEAAANIFYALNFDPTLSGFAGGSKQGARSGGSDKREAYLIALQMLSPFREMVLEPLDFVAQYNGWTTRYPDLKFRFRDTLLTTLDTGAGTKKVLS